MSTIMKLSNMQLTTQLGTDFWNDSCDPKELAEAVEEGAVGATSNPVIVGQAVEGDRDRWMPVLDRLVEERPRATEAEITWALVEHVGREAAEILEPVYARTGARKGYLSMQVNPQFYRDADRMVDHAVALARVAPNVAIKIPATAPGLAAIEELTSLGIRINATVCFTLAQAIACAEAVERGIRKARAAGLDVTTVLPTVTLMVGRLDDHLDRVRESERISVDPGWIHWAGIAVFKKTHRAFAERGYRSTLLAAAYRHHLHWTELVGENVIETIPYPWWKQFNASRLRPRPSLAEPVREEIVAGLSDAFVDFRRAYEEDGLRPDEFVRYGASIHTLRQFLGGYARLIELVRGRMLA